MGLTLLIEIDSALKRVCPALRLGVAIADVSISKKVDSLWDALVKEGQSVASGFSDLAALYNAAPIQAARDTFRACGKDPARYAVSSEALVARVLQGKALYQVNSVVDINNLVSIRCLHSVGAYDLSKIEGAIKFRIGSPGDSYKAIGKIEVNLEGLPIFCDGRGPFGSPFSDSERTMIQLGTTKIMMVIISFLNDPKLQLHLDFLAANLKEFASASQIETAII